MKVFVVGIEKTQGVSKKTGQPYTGTRVHYTQEVQSDKLDGIRADNAWFPSRIDFEGVVPGMMIEIYYNQYGNPDAIKVC